MQHLRYPRSQVSNVVLATAASLVLVSLMWVYERELIWMIAVFLPPIWISVLRQYSAADQAHEASSAVWPIVAGLAALCLVGVLVYVQ